MSGALNFNNGSNWISSINTTRDGVGSGSMGGIDGNGMYFSQTPSGGSMSYMYLKGGTGLSIAGNIYPISNYTYNLGNSSYEWAHASIRVVCTRHLDADDAYSGDNNLYIGYGAGKQTNKTLFYYSTSDSRTQFAEVNSYGLYALTRFGVAGQSTSYTFYVNGTSYLKGWSLINDSTVILPPISYTTLINSYGLRSDYTSAGYPIQDFLQAWCKYAYEQGAGYTVHSYISPSSRGYIVADVYTSGLVTQSQVDGGGTYATATVGLPVHITGRYYPHGGSEVIFGTSYGTWYYRTGIDTGNYTSYLGYIGTTPVQASSANQAMTGITSIAGPAGNINLAGNFHIDATGNWETYINYYTGKNIYMCAGTNKGKVGIRTTSPREALDVYGASAVFGGNGVQYPIQITRAYNDSVNFLIGSAAAGSLNMRISNNSSAGNGEVYIDLISGGTGISANPKLGVNTSTLTYTFNVAGKSYFTQDVRMAGGYPFYVRDSAEGWNMGIFGEMSGNDCMTFVADNAVTSFMFCQGQGNLSGWTSGKFNSVTPAMQIKNNSVYINKLLANGVSPVYKLYVEGQVGINTLDVTKPANLNFPYNAFAINFRPGGSYTTGFFYGTYGNEFLALTTQQSVTSLIFGNGYDPYSLASGSFISGDGTNYTYSASTNVIQIKQNCVNIGDVWKHNITPDYKLKINGTTYITDYLRVSGGIARGSEHILSPAGGSYTNNNSSVTGYIIIRFPHSLIYTMMSVWIDVYSYSTNKSFSVQCGAYTYDNSFGHAPFAMCIGAAHKVRYCYDTDYYYIVVGESNSSWSYPKFMVRDMLVGYSRTVDNWIDKSLSCYIDTTLPGTESTSVTRYTYTIQTMSTTSVAGLYCGDYSGIYVARSSNETMSLNTTPVEGSECHIVIYNNGSSNITITLPTSYRRNVASIVIAAGAFGEVNILTVNSIVHIRAV